MAKGQEAMDFHQSYFKKPRIQPLDLEVILELAKDFNSYILLSIYCPFLWTFSKVWPLNSMASQLGWAYCEL